MPETVALHVGHTFVVAGPPGAGKSTFSAAMDRSIGVQRFAVRLRLESLRAKGHPLAKSIDRAMQGCERFIPDRFIEQMLDEFLETTDSSQHIVLEGIPINQQQAASIVSVLKHYGRSLTRVIVLTADESILLRRIRDRRVCLNKMRWLACRLQPVSLLVHVVVLRYCEQDAGAGMPIAAGIVTCPRCGAPVSHRRDDNAIDIANRLENFDRERNAIFRTFQSAILVELDTSTLTIRDLEDRAADFVPLLAVWRSDSLGSVS